MCQEVQSLRRHLGILAVFPQHLMKHEENVSHLASEVQAMRQQQKEFISDISSERNRTSHMRRAETSAREQELNTLSFQLNSTKAEFIQLVETTNRTLNKKRNERLTSLETKIISRLRNQGRKVKELQEQQKQADASISALKKVSLF